MLLIIVDAHSNWIDVHITNSSTVSVTIPKLLITFSTHGLTRTIVSENGLCFTSSEFEQFVKCNGIRHLKTAPYHPASNGLTERAVQTVKGGICHIAGGDLESKVVGYLARYRVTPQSTTGSSPAQLLIRRQIRTKLDLINPKLSDRVFDSQNNQRKNSTTIMPFNVVVM